MSGQDDAAFVATFDSTKHVVLPFRLRVDLTVDWGDGTVEPWTTDQPSHRYAHEGRWTVSVVGQAQSMFYCHTSVVEVLQWGRLGLTSTRRAFQNCENLTAVPNNTDGLEAVTDMAHMFDRATSFNGPVCRWDVGHVNKMGGMFDRATSFNQPLNDWDVSAVTNMAYMFYNATSFNQPLNDWDVSAVTNMAYMFDGAGRFFQDLSGWTIRIPHGTNERNFLKALTGGTMLAGALLPNCETARMPDR